jgi:hypothetical protein
VGGRRDCAALPGCVLSKLARTHVQVASAGPVLLVYRCSFAAVAEQLPTDCNKIRAQPTTCIECVTVLQPLRCGAHVAAACC